MRLCFKSILTSTTIRVKKNQKFPPTWESALRSAKHLMANHSGTVVTMVISNASLKCIRIKKWAMQYLLIRVHQICCWKIFGNFWLRGGTLLKKVRVLSCGCGVGCLLFVYGLV